MGMATMISDESAVRNISENLQRLLDDRGWTQAHLAKLTGESSTTITRVVRGLNKSGPGILARIAEALDVSIDRLVGPPPRKFANSAELPRTSLDTVPTNL